MYEQVPEAGRAQISDIGAEAKEAREAGYGSDEIMMSSVKGGTVPDYKGFIPTSAEELEGVRINGEIRQWHIDFLKAQTESQSEASAGEYDAT